MPQEMTEEAVQKIVQAALETQKKDFELSSTKELVKKLQDDNEKLATRLASVEEVQQTIDNVQDTLEEEADAGEDSTALGEVLEKVVALDEAFEELASKFENVVSNIKTVTPMEAGIGKMSTSSDEDNAEDAIADVSALEETTEELATPEEIVAAIEVIETYMEEVGDLVDVAEDADSEGEEVSPLEESSKKAKEALATILASIKKPAKTPETASKVDKVQALKKQILAKKPVETSSKVNIQSLAEKIKARSFDRQKTVETSSVAETFEAGSLAGNMFAKRR